MYEALKFLGITTEKVELQKQDEIVEEPLTYLRRILSTDYPTKLRQAFNHWLNISADKFDLIKEIHQTLHTACLLIDDVEDNATLRRNVPVAHSIYGFARTLNAAGYGVLLAAEKVCSLKNLDANKIFTHEMLDLYRGKGMEIYWRETLAIPNESEYMAMAVRKMAGSFSLSIRLMQLFSTNKKDFSKLVGMLALYHQILDDLFEIEKDITEGKFGFPMVHAMNKLDNNDELLNILRQRTRDQELKKHYVSLLEKCGSIQYTEEKLQSLENEIREETARLGPNPCMKDLLDELFRTKRRRESEGTLNWLS